ncbi:MAG: hypothetical protein ACLFTQ_01195 [Candidatus Aenigmatarchaeota archaeon]
MPNITLSVDEDLKKMMEEHKEINWSQVARKSIKEEIEDLEVMEKITSRSELTEKEVEEISDQVNRKVAKKVL